MPAVEIEKSGKILSLQLEIGPMPKDPYEYANTLYWVGGIVPRSR